MRRDLEPCDVGDHYSCEKMRPACTCTCHPRHRLPPDRPDGLPPTTGMTGAIWHPDPLRDDAA